MGWVVGLGRIWWRLIAAAVLVLAASSVSQVSAQRAVPLPGGCPLDFPLLDAYPLVKNKVRSSSTDVNHCLFFKSGLEVLFAVYLNHTGYFLPPPEATQACIRTMGSYFQVQNISEQCGVSPASISRGADNCLGIQTAEDFRRAIAPASLNSCSGVLAIDNIRTAACAACTRDLTLVANSLQTNGSGSGKECASYSRIYAAAEVVTTGPASARTLACLWDIMPVIWKPIHTPRSMVYTAVSIGLFLFCLLVFGTIFCLIYRSRERPADIELVGRTVRMLLGSVQARAGERVLWYTIQELRAATGNFNPDAVLGEGGYATVYRATLPDGSVVACKRFKDPSPAGDAPFMQETQALASVQHKNLVRLRGCCIANEPAADNEGPIGHERIIVLDFVPNGTLDDHLYDDRFQCLTWQLRLKIATDTARGLTHLHTGSSVQILHRDIKPGNILLEEDFSARVADFGLAEFTSAGVTRTTAEVVGSMGYLAPEYAQYNQLTDRSDVYSFGILLLVIISGRSAVTPDPCTRETVIEYARRIIRNPGHWRDIVDPRLVEIEPDVLHNEELERFLRLALLCAHDLVCYRPDMASVLRMLEGAQEVPPVPDNPAPSEIDMDDIRELLPTPPYNPIDGSFTSTPSSTATI